MVFDYAKIDHQEGQVVQHQHPCEEQLTTMVLFSAKGNQSHSVKKCIINAQCKQFFYF